MNIQSARATAPSEALKRAGTSDARGFKYQNGQNEECTVEGGDCTDPAFQGTAPGPLQSRFTKAFIRWSWGRSDLFQDYLRTTGQAPAYAAYKPITGKELAALAKPGPDNAPPILQPGDLICNGSLGATGHVLVYVGDNEKNEPQIIHAMATQYEGRSFIQRLFDWFRVIGLGWNPDKIGVIKEGLAEFVDRYVRDTIIVVRDPRMNPEMRERFLRRIAELIGQPYDYNLSPKHEGYYCTELVKEGTIAAYKGTGLPMPWMGTTWVEAGKWPYRIAQWVFQPENLELSPDYQFVWANQAGQDAYEKIHRTVVCGKPAQASSH